MKNKAGRPGKNTVCFAVMAALTCLTLYILLKDNSMSTLLGVLKKAKLRYVLLGLICMLSFVLCEAGIMRMLAATWRGRIGWKRAVEYSFAGFYFSSITPSSTGGQPMQLYYMVRDGINGARSSFVLLTITAFYQLASLIYGITMICLRFEYIKAQPLAIHLLIIFGIAANGISSLFILTAVFCRPLVEAVIYGGIRFLGKLRLVKHGDEMRAKAVSMIEEYSQGSIYLRQYPMLIVKAAAVTFAQLTFLFAASYCACLALGLGGVGFWNFVMLQSVLTLAVSAVPLPGAVGATESGFLVMFGGFFTQAQLLPVMILGRGISFYGFLILSGLVVLHLQSRRAVSLGVGSAVSAA